MPKTYVAQHEAKDGKILRWCVRCGLHVTQNNEFDLDYYNARFYHGYLQVPVEKRCTHIAPPGPKTNEEILEMIDNCSHGGFSTIPPNMLSEIFKAIISRLK